MPFPLALVAFALALLLAVKSPRLARTYLALGMLLLLVFSNPWVAWGLIKPLEKQAPVFVAEQYQGKPINWIVVLGNSHRNVPDLPLSSQLSDSALKRLVEGLRLKKAFPDAKLILSGWSGQESLSHGETLKAVAEAIMDLPEEDLLVNSRPRDTQEEAVAVADQVGDAPVLLVTSASHMRRARSIFLRSGVSVIPAPTDFLFPPSNAFRQWLPSAHGLVVSQIAIHEYLGLCWSYLVPYLTEIEVRVNKIL